MRHGASVTFVLRRMRSARLLLGCVLAAAIITAALAAALADFGGQDLGQAADRQLAAGSGLSVQVNGALSARQARRDDQVVPAVLRRALGPLRARVTSATWSDPLGLPGPAGPAVPIAEVAALGGSRGQTRLTAGSWPGPPRPGHPIGVTVPASVAAAIGARPGQELTVRDRDSGAVIRLRVTGWYQITRPAAPYWGLDLLPVSGLASSGGFRTYGPLLADSSAFGPGLLTVGQASWLARPGRYGVPAGELGPLSGRITAAVARLRAASSLGGLQAATALPQRLAGLAASYAVARSLLAVSGLQLLLVAVAALALAARLLAGQREEEAALLAARGASRAQLGGAAVAEAVVLAAIAAAAALPLGHWLASSLGTAAGAARGGPGPAVLTATAAAAVAAVLVTAVAVLAWPALRPSTPAAARARRGRQAALAGAARAGADVAVLVLALLAAWQLHRYAAAGPGRSAGIDPVLVAAPALLLAAAALVPLRLLPALARLAERTARRGRRAAAALASWEVSRRPVRQTGPALLAIVAVAAGTLALTQQGSWHQSGRDQAAHAVGADVRVSLGGALLPGRVAAITGARGVRTAMAVSSFNGAVGGTVLAIGARQAAATVLLRADQAPLAAGPLWQTITPAGRPPGLAIPGRPVRLAVTARLSAVPRSWRLGALAATLSVQDASGAVYDLPAGRLVAGGGSQQLIAPIGPGRQADYPLRLLDVTWSYQLPPVTAPAARRPGQAQAESAGLRGTGRRRVTLTVTGVSAAASPAGPLPAPFASGQALAGWRAGGASPGLAQSASGLFGLPAATGWHPAANGGQALTFRPGYEQQFSGSGTGPAAGTLEITAGPVPAVLPGIATRSFLAASSATPGATIAVTASGIPVRVRIAAVIGSFPTVGSGGALIVDQGALAQVLAAQGAASEPVTGWWLATAGGRVPAGLPPGLAVSDARSTAAALARAPLAAAPLTAAAAAGGAAALLAMLGFAVSVAATVRERRARRALLAALGVSRAAQAGQLCLEQLLLVAPAAAGGLALGAVVARLLVPAVTLTAQAARPVPAAVVVLPLGPAVALAAAVTALPVAAAALTAWRRPDPAGELRAAELA